MVDNVTADPGTGGATFKTDDDGTAHWPYTKMAWGADNTQTRVTTGAGAVPVQDGGNSLTVDNGGTFAVQAAQSGTWNVTNISGTVSLPTGAATEAKQPALGTAGAAASDVISVQGIASMTPILVDATGQGDVPITLAGESVAVTNTNLDNAHSADFDTGAGTDTTPAFGIAVPASGGAAVVPGDATAGLKVDLGADNDVTVTGSVTANAGTNLNTSLLALESGGNLATLAGAVTGTEMQVDVVAALPAGTNAIGKLAANSGVDIGDVDVTSIVPGTGATNLGKAEDAVHATGDVGVMALSVRTNTATARAGTDGDYQPLITDTNGRLHVKLPSNEPINMAQMSGVNVTMGNGVSGTGVQRVTIASDSTGQVKLAANSGVDVGDVDVTSISAGSNLIGDVGISGARTSGGTSIFRSIDLDETEEEIKATAGQIYWIHATNTATTPRYLKIYNATAATVVVGTTTPVLTFLVPSQGDANGAGFVLSIPNGIAFGTAITAAATTGVADADTGAPGANEVIVNIGYA